MSLYTILGQITPDGVNLPNEVNPNGNGGFLTEQLQTVLQITFGILGAIAVLVIVVSGLQYILSAGDPQKVARAKDAIIYACIGLVVAILAFSIVSFVLDGAFK
jgi:hypothetical protein